VSSLSANIAEDETVSGVNTLLDHAPDGRRPAHTLAIRTAPGTMCAMERRELASEIYRRAHLEGQFTLRSGLAATEYFDKYRFESDPALLRAICEALQPLLPRDVDALAGLELGGVPLAAVLAQLTGLPALFVRKQAKTYGTCQLAEGGDIAGRRLAIVEDVVTTAGQIIASARELRARGAHVAYALVVIDRDQGGASKLAAAGIELRALFSIHELRPA
jgi:orotate phosphoribosyltransferase